MQDGTQPSVRDALQAMRGIAAACVLFHHSLLTVAGADTAAFIGGTIINPHAAVVFFFVLSGFVLTLSLIKKTMSTQTTTAFLIKRLFRIYPALWAGVTVGLLYFTLSLHVPRTDFSPWVLAQYSKEKMTVGMMVGTFLGLKTALLPVLWTIKVELAASLLMPFFAFVLAAKRLWMTAALMVTLTIMSFVIHTIIPIYLVHFSLGALLAVHLDVAMRFRARWWSMALAVVTLVFFRQTAEWDYHAPIPGAVEALASAALILAVCQGALTALRHPVLVRLGDWSYSLYLLHMPTAFILTFAASGMLGLGLSADMAALVISLATFAIATGLSATVYRYVELPFIGLGKRVSEKLSCRKNAAGAVSL